jgi:hypothetical protein
MFKLPENLGDLSVAELQALIDQGLDAYRELGVTPESADDVIAQAEAIADAVTAVHQAKEAAEAKATKEAADAQGKVDKIADLNARMEGTRKAPAKEDKPEDEPGAEPAPTSVPAEPAKPQEPYVPEDPGLQPTGKELVTAAAANGGKAVVPARRRAVAAALTAAADVPGYPLGAELDGLDAVTAAVMSRARGLPTQRIGGDEGVRHRYGAAAIKLQGYEELSQDVTHDDMALLTAAASEHRLPGGSLTAAGGWCAPSETLYDLCQHETVDGLIDMPEMQITRGGIRWTEGPDFSDIYTACGFLQTEANAIAGVVKPCCQVSCPSFTELRMDAIGMCVKTPLLTETAYPELTRRFVEGALVAHQHKVNANVIGRMVTAAGAAKNFSGQNSSTALALNILDLQAVGMRYAYRLGQTSTIEVIAPFWLKAIIRADWGMRQVPQSVADSAINAWFSERNMNVQWVYDWQNLAVTGCAVTIPGDVQVLMYPAGTWVRGRADVINMDAVYDSVGLESNVYTALFVEEGILAVQRCTHTCNVQLDICISGRTGAADIATCLLTASA